MCKLHILDDSIFIGHVSLFSRAFHNKTSLWHLRLEHFRERGLVELSK